MKGAPFCEPSIAHVNVLKPLRPTYYSSGETYRGLVNRGKQRARGQSARVVLEMNSGGASTAAFRGLDQKHKAGKQQELGAHRPTGWGGEGGANEARRQQQQSRVPSGRNGAHKGTHTHTNT